MTLALIALGGCAVLAWLRWRPAGRPRFTYRCNRCTHVSDTLEARAEHQRKAHR